LAGLGALGCAASILAAIAAEVTGSPHSNSQVPSWAERVFPLGWPQRVGVAWWLAVGAATVGYRLTLHPIGQRAWVVISVVPFVVFTGVAVGAGWATWH
jgi:hypothetical protein